LLLAPPIFNGQELNVCKPKLQFSWSKSRVVHFQIALLVVRARIFMVSLIFADEFGLQKCCFVTVWPRPCLERPLLRRLDGMTGTFEARLGEIEPPAMEP